MGDPNSRTNLFVSHVNCSPSFVRKCWPLQGSSVWRETPLPGTSFLHTEGGGEGTPLCKSYRYVLACEQALLFGRAKRVSREHASERRSREGQARSREARPNRRACSHARYVPSQGVWFLRRFGLKTGIDFAHFGLESYGFQGIYGMSLKTNLLFQFQMSKKESETCGLEMDFDFFCWRSSPSNDDLISAYYRS